MPLKVVEISSEYDVEKDGHKVSVRLFIPSSHTTAKIGEMYVTLLLAMGGMGKVQFADIQWNSDKFLELSQRMFEIEQAEKNQPPYHYKSLEDFIDNGKITGKTFTETYNVFQGIDGTIKAVKKQK